MEILLSISSAFIKALLTPNINYASSFFNVHQKSIRLAAYDGKIALTK